MTVSVPGDGVEDSLTHALILSGCLLRVPNSIQGMARAEGEEHHRRGTEVTSRTSVRSDWRFRMGVAIAHSAAGRLDPSTRYRCAT